MKHLSRKEISVLFFTAYFYYGRSRFGKEEDEEVRRGKITASRSVMRLARLWFLSEQKVPHAAKAEAFAALAYRAERLPDGMLKSAYIETLSALELIIS
jgi:hypothetical protein